MFKVYNAAGEEKLNESGFAPQAVVCKARANANVSMGNSASPQGAPANLMPVKVFDPFNFWTPATNRFQPNIPGYYRCVFCVTVDSFSAAGADFEIYLRKNGSSTPYEGSVGSVANPGTWAMYEATALVYLNGTTDYVDLAFFMNGAASARWRGDSANPTMFEATLEAASVGVAPEPWTRFTYQNGWVDHNPGVVQVGRYMKDPHGFVHLEGIIRNTAGFSWGAASATPTTLPPGYRPAVNEDFPAGASDPNGNGMIIVRVAPNGTISGQGGYAGASFGGGIGGTWNLNGITYKAEA